jgi:hypothetical protein
MTNVDFAEIMDQSPSGYEKMTVLSRPSIAMFFGREQDVRKDQIGILNC